jgi:hypothetical protein
LTQEIRRRIGEGVALVLYFIIDAYEVWPQSHSIALLAAVIGASAVLFAEWSFKPWLISTCILFMAAITTYLISGPIPPPEPWQGWLQAANEPTPPNGCTQTPPAPDITPDSLILVAGGNGITYGAANGKYNAVLIGNCPSLILDKAPEGLRVSAPIYDNQNNLLGTIIDNGYKFTKERSLIVEHTGDLSTLVVHNQNGEEILYVHYANSHAIKIRGTFYCPSVPGRGLVITEDRLAYKPNGISMRTVCMGKAGFAAFCLDCGSQ